MGMVYLGNGWVLIWWVCSSICFVSDGWRGLLLHEEKTNLCSKPGLLLLLLLLYRRQKKLHEKLTNTLAKLLKKLPKKILFQRKFCKTLLSAERIYSVKSLYMCTVTGMGVHLLCLMEGALYVWQIAVPQITGHHRNGPLKGSFYFHALRVRQGVITWNNHIAQIFPDLWWWK